MNLVQQTNVTFTAAGLPVIGDYGKIYTDSLVGLYKVASNAAKFTDDSGLSHDIVNVGTTVAAGVPTWAGGILSVPDGNAIEAGKYNRLALSPVDADLTKTFAILVKVGPSALSYAFYLLHNLAVNLFWNSNQLQAIYNNGTSRSPVLTAMDGTIWNLVVMSIDATGVNVSLNGGPYANHLFASLGGAPTAAASTAYMGAASTAQGLRGDIAFVGQYERAMTQSEAISTYRGIKRWAKDNKNISI